MRSVAIPVWRSSGATAAAAGDSRAGVGRWSSDNFVFLSSMIHAHADDLFHGMRVKGCYQFRLTRNADPRWTPRTSRTARALRGELISRRYGDAVRPRGGRHRPQHRRTPAQAIQPGESEMYRSTARSIRTRLFSITGPIATRAAIQPVHPVDSEALQNSDKIFSVINKQDIPLLHPFESFTPVVDLLREAAKDPCVLAIKQTLYRSGANSEIVDALVDAARSGKEVTAVIELRARFDEESNP